VSSSFDVVGLTAFVRMILWSHTWGIHQ